MSVFIFCVFLPGITKEEHSAALKRGVTLSFVCADCQERNNRGADRTENDDEENLEEDEDDVLFFVSSR